MLGELIGGLSDIYSAHFSAREASKNRSFQAHMSNTAHQREVADLRAAGLNPVLSAMKGAGASTPSGSSASMAPMGSTLTNARLAAKQMESIDAQIGKTKAETALLSKNVPTAELQNEVLRKLIGFGRDAIGGFSGSTNARDPVAPLPDWAKEFERKHPEVRKYRRK